MAKESNREFSPSNSLYPSLIRKLEKQLLELFDLGELEKREGGI